MDLFGGVGKVARSNSHRQQWFQTASCFSLGSFKQHTHGWSIVERRMFDQVLAVAGGQGLEGQIPKWTIRKDSKNRTALKLSFNGSNQVAVQGPCIRLVGQV